MIPLFIEVPVPILSLECKQLCIYSTLYVAKSIGTCKNNHYIINQNHIFSKKYFEVISG
jgi:hypothetical protein